MRAPPAPLPFWHCGAALLLLLSLSGRCTAPTLGSRLAHHGRPHEAIARDSLPPIAEFVVVVHRSAPPSDEYAAQQLAAHLGGLKIVPTAPTNSPYFAVGVDAAAVTIPKARLVSLTSGSTTGAFACYSTARSVALTGGRGETEGTLNSIFEYLRLLGFRWWTSTHHTVPHLPGQMRALHCNRTFQPPMEYRLYNAFVVSHGSDEWRVRNHMTGAMDTQNLHALNASMGGSIGYADNFFVHTFYQLVNESLFASNPDWFSLTFDKRRATTYGSCKQAQLCLSNASLREHVVSQALEVAAGAAVTNDAQQQGQVGLRSRTILSISQNDCSSGSRCQCEHCHAAEVADGAMSGLFTEIAELVAAALRQRYPDGSVIADSLAYDFTEDPAKQARVNVSTGHVVRFAPSDATQAVPLRAQTWPYQPGSNNLTPEQQLTGWAAAAQQGGGKIWSWLYYNNFADFVMMQPNWFNIAPDVQFLATYNVSGVFAEGLNGNPSADMNELRAWLLASISFDPARNGTALIQEFLSGYYSAAAAPYVYRHMQIWQDSVIRHTNATTILGKWELPTATWVTPAAILDSAAALLSAIDVAGASSVGKEHLPQLDRLWISTRYLLLWRWRETCDYAAGIGADWPVATTLEDGACASLLLCKPRSETANHLPYPR